MKILAPYAYFAPEHAASSYLWQNLHEDFANDGHYCYVYTPMPTRGVTDEVRKEYKKKKHELLYDGKLEVQRFSLWNEPKDTAMRFVRYIAQCTRQYFSLVFASKKWDVIFAASTPPIIGATCALIKKAKGIPFVYNLQDIFPDSLMGTNITKKKGMLWMIGRKLEDFPDRNADKIIVITEDFKKNIMAKGVSEEKIVVVYNWVDQNAVVSVPREENRLFDEYSIDRSKFYIEYSGNIGLTQNMDMLLEVMKDLKESHPQIGLILVGDGAYKKQVEEIVARDGLTNVTMLPFQDYKDISLVFSLGEAGLVISKPGVGSNSVPSKTWSIMSASRPVLANFDENELKDILTANECGIFTKAGDKAAFRKSVITLYENRELCKKYGENGRKFIMENLTREIGTQKYVDVIKSVVEGKKG